MKGFYRKKKGKLGHVGKIKGMALLALIAPPPPDEQEYESNY